MTQSTNLKKELQRKTKKLGRNVRASRKINDYFESFKEKNMHYSQENTAKFLRGSEIFDSYNEYKSNGDW